MWPEATVTDRRRCVEVSGAEGKISDSFVKSQSLEGPPLYLHRYSKRPLAEAQVMDKLCDRLSAVEERVADIFPGTSSCCGWASDGLGTHKRYGRPETLMEPADQITVLCHCMLLSTTKQVMVVSQPWLLGQGLLLPKACIHYS